MKYTISDDRRTLTIHADAAERQAIREREDISSDQALHEEFERMVCDSELDWVSPGETGDLTSAPMLGILNEPEFKRHNHKVVSNLKNRIVRCSTDGLMVATVSERWAFMDYQVRSPLEDLRDTGEAVFIS